MFFCVGIIVVLSNLGLNITRCNNTKIEDSWPINHRSIKIISFDGVMLEIRLQSPNESTFQEKYEDTQLQLRAIAGNNSVTFRIENGTYSGIVGDVLTALMHSMNSSFHLQRILKSVGGWDDRNLEWTGALSKIKKGRADFLAHLMTMSSSLSEDFDITIPLMMTRTHLIIKKPNSAGKINWLAYFQIFEKKVWVTIMVIMFSASVLLTLIKYNPQRNRLWSMTSDNYLDVFGIFCQQGLLGLPAQPSLRITYFSIILTSLIVLAAYSASVISILSVPPKTLPFESFREFSEQKEYKLIMMKDAVTYDWFYNAELPLERKLFQLMLPKDMLPVNSRELFHQVCNEKVAFYGSIVNFPTNMNLPCEIVYIGRHSTINYALLLPMKSPHTKIFNHHIMKLHNNGVLKCLINKYYARDYVDPSIDEKAREVDLLSFTPLLVLLCGGILISFFILAFEFMCCGFKRNESPGTSDSTPRYLFNCNIYIDLYSEKFALLKYFKN